MISTIEIKCNQISMKKMMDYFKPETINVYCKQCNNYKNNHSCPDFKFDVESYLEPFNYATVIMTALPTNFIDIDDVMSNPKRYSSRVFNNYQKDKASTDIYTMVSMYYFNQVKERMEQTLLSLESEYNNGMISSPPGSCTRCELCSRINDEPCRLPTKLRYSLESLGFEVSSIYRHLFNTSLTWAKERLPDVFYTCSAIFTIEPINIEKINETIKNEGFIKK